MKASVLITCAVIGLFIWAAYTIYPLFMQVVEKASQLQ